MMRSRPHLAEHLRAVRVEENSLLAAQSADFLQRLGDADLIVDAHHGHQAGLVRNCVLEVRERDETVLLHRQIRDLEASFGKPAATIQHALVLLWVSENGKEERFEL